MNYEDTLDENWLFHVKHNYASETKDNRNRDDGLSGRL